MSERQIMRKAAWPLAGALLAVGVVAAQAPLAARKPRAAGAAAPAVTQPTDTQPARASKGRGGSRQTAPALTEEQSEELLAFLKRHYKQRYDWLTKLKSSDPAGYDRSLRWSWRLYQQFQGLPPEVQQASIRLVDSRVRIGKLVQKLREAKPEGTPALVEELRAAVGEQLDDEHVFNRYRLSMLEKRIADLRAELRRQVEQRDQVIDERLEHLLESTRKTSSAPKGDQPRPATRPAT